LSVALRSCGETNRAVPATELNPHERIVTNSIVTTG
jgi:hypothetical protein